LFRINLGDRVKCVVTGYTGIVMERAEDFNGVVRYLVLPFTGPSFQFEGGAYFSPHILHIVDHAVVPPGAPDAVLNAEIGDYVVDELTGVSGYCQSRSTLIDGVVTYTVGHFENGYEWIEEAINHRQLKVRDGYERQNWPHAPAWNPGDGVKAAA